ncbi:MAG: glycosyltransferase family 2 protein [Bacteroidales bacterium]|nr:glycosyltransferase family 2 protein [Bacteroidales bacterium]
MITILAYIVAGFLLLRFFVVIINALSPLHLPERKAVTDDTPLVSVLIPARDEEEHIEKVIRDIYRLTYRNLEVIVYDDQSQDLTPTIVERLKKEYPPLRLLEGKPLPKGWLGKNHACHNLATEAKGSYLLFLDADVSVSGDLIEQLMAYCRRHRLQLLSLFPKQIMRNISGFLTIPMMNWILLSLLPMILIRKSRWESFSAANGQCMFFETDSYKKHNWHKIVKQRKAEDIAILRMMKRYGYKTATLLGDKRMTCVMYNTLQTGIEGFSKNIQAFFGNSIVWMFVFILLSQAGVIVLLIASWHWSLITGFLGIGLLIHVIVTIKSKQPLLMNMLLLLPRQVVFLFIAYKSVFYSITKKGIWKGRPI